MTDRINEVLRYLGGGKEANAPVLLQQQIQKTLAQLDDQLSPKSLHRVFPLQHEPDGSITLLAAPGKPAFTLTGQLANTMLKSCHQAVLLLATLGLTFDAMLRTQQARSMAEAAILDACGNVLVEEACDRMEQDIQQHFPNLHLSDRFSPGYGDLPLPLQKELLHALDAQRNAGVYLSDTYLMTPAKTVTAIVGLSSLPQQAKIRGCAYCSLRDTCTIRKDGKRCDPL